MTFFRNAIERRAEEAISLNPSVQTGYVINTASVIDKATKNPFFHTLNRMSALDSSKLNLDSVKSGVSIGVKNANGITRAKRVFINPKFTNLELIGTISGHSPTSEQKGIRFADLIFSGANNQAPTVVGQQFIPVEIKNNTQSTTQDVAQNSVQGTTGSTVGVNAGGAFGAATVNKSESPVKVDVSSVGPAAIGAAAGGSVGSATVQPVPPLLDKNGKPTNKADKTGRGPWGNSIRTGTLKISQADLRQIVLGATGFF